MHWRAYARPFARNRRFYRRLAGKHLMAAMEPSVAPDKRMGHARTSGEHRNTASAITGLWRDFIAHMRAGGE